MGDTFISILLVLYSNINKLETNLSLICINCLRLFVVIDKGVIL